MTDRLLRPAERIRAEVVELARVVERAQMAWHKVQQSADDLYLDSAALNLHGFYAGLERLFELIASVVDDRPPQGAKWHQVLLDQMADEVPHERPAVISEETRAALDEYRSFRHIVRNVYTFRFDPTRVQSLVERLPGVFEQARQELLSFAAFLEQQAQMGEDQS